MTKQKQYRVAEIPAYGICLKKNGKPCIFAAYAAHLQSYDCRLYGRLLKGADRPVKCQECVDAGNAVQKSAKAVGKPKNVPGNGKEGKPNGKT